MSEQLTQAELPDKQPDETLAAWCERRPAQAGVEIARLRAELKAAAERVAEVEAERDRLMECRMTRAEIVAALSSASGYEDEDVTSDMVDAFSHGWRAARAAVDAGDAGKRKGS